MAAAAPINTVAHLALAYRSVPLISLMPAVRSCVQTPRRSLRNPQPRSEPAPSAPSTITADCCSDDLPQKIAQILQYFEEEVFTSIHARAVKCRMCLLEQVGWRDIPAHLKEAPMTAAKLRELFEEKHIYMTWYTCPVITCRVSVERKPIEVDIAKHMIDAVNSTLGAPTCQVDSNSLPQHPANVWADVFYEDDRYITNPSHEPQGSYGPYPAKGDPESATPSNTVYDMWEPIVTSDRESRGAVPPVQRLAPYLVLAMVLHLPRRYCFRCTAAWMGWIPTLGHKSLPLAAFYLRQLPISIGVMTGYGSLRNSLTAHNQTYAWPEFNHKITRTTSYLLGLFRLRWEINPCLSHRISLEWTTKVFQFTLVQSLSYLNTGSMATELECLQQYRNMFQSSVLSFTPPRLKFLPSHTVGAGVQPPLDLTDTKGSRSLMVHREFMQKLLELVEAVVSNGEEVTTTRKKLVMDIQEHQRYVDRLVDCEWRRQHAGMTGSQSSVMSLPIIVNTGMSTSYRL
ncbi:hypothetical protein EDD17DRAFT_1855446 [Pisolithus thermaeus]|nr:hypothetical protein EDD17DRAFT_1855446 [Pisolithus thermaeus]